MSQMDFIEDLKTSKWCGPFIWNQYTEWAEFYTVTKQGKFQGIRLILRFDEPDIRLHYVTDTIKLPDGRELDPDDITTPRIFN